MVHELNFLQYNALCFPQSLKLETPKTLKMIKELGMRRPVSNILQLNPKRDFNLLKKFSLCLSKSSVEEMIKSTSGMFIFYFISGDLELYFLYNDLTYVNLKLKFTKLFFTTLYFSSFFLLI